MSRGSGESRDSLIALRGVKDEDKARFVQVTKSNLGQIFPSETSGTEEIMAGLKRVLTSDRALAPYSTAI